MLIQIGGIFKEIKIFYWNIQNAYNNIQENENADLIPDRASSAKMSDKYCLTLIFNRNNCCYY